MSKSARRRSALLWAGAVIWVLGPVAVLGFGFFVDRSARFAEPQLVWTSAVEPSDEIGSNVELALEWGATDPLVAPAWAGLVTAVVAQPGQVISSGDAVVGVDGVERRAVHTPGPFWRPLPLNAKGPDAQWLNDTLRSFGLPAADSDVVTSSTVKGVTAFARQIGVRDEQRVFEPSWVLYLPSAQTTVGNVLVAAGHPAPAMGEPIFEGVSELKRAVITASGSSPREPEETTTEAEPAQAAPGPAAGNIITAAPGEQLWWGNEELPLDDAHQAVSPDALGLLSAALTVDDLVAPARLQRVPEAGEVQIPAGAIFSTVDEDACIVLSRDGKRLAMPVDIVAGSAGNTIVRGQVKNGDRVLMSPPAELRRC